MNVKMFGVLKASAQLTLHRHTHQHVFETALKNMPVILTSKPKQ